MKKSKGLMIFSVMMIALLCCTANPAKAQPPKTKKSGTRIQKTNWANSMGCTFNDGYCVALATDDILAFKLVVRFADPVINDYPPMHFNYYFPDYNPSYPLFGYTGPVTADIIEPTLLETGDSAWKASFYFEFELESHCAREDSFFFGVEYQLVMPHGSGYAPYPVGVYPRLFPIDTFDVAPGDFAKYYTAEKKICCNNEVYDCSEDAHHRIGARGEKGRVDLEKSFLTDQIHIFPNPTTSYVNIHFDQALLEQAQTLRVFDASGKLMPISESLNTNDLNWVLDTSEWPSGVYFLRFSSANQSIVKKILK